MAYTDKVIKVNVICGGQSGERAVSLRSGAAIADALTQAGYNVSTLDTTASDSAIAQCDVVFPMLHGEGGEDGQIQRRLETLGLTYVGTGPDASALCMDKGRYREVMMAQGLTIAAGGVVTLAQFQDDPLTQQPYVLKPINGGSTIDTFIVHDPAQADVSAIGRSFETYHHMLLEELIDGIEITVGVLGYKALPIIEIIPPVSGEFDYENKYNGKTQELCPPLHVAESLQRRAQQLALRVHAIAGCRDVSRTDFIIGSQDNLYLLETNTIPGMTAQSLYPKMALNAGITFPELVDQLVRYALSR